MLDLPGCTCNDCLAEQLAERGHEIANLKRLWLMAAKEAHRTGRHKGLFANCHVMVCLDVEERTTDPL